MRLFKIKLFTLLTFQSICSFNAQNLVNNPGLEITSSSPTGYNQLNLANGWSNCNGNYITQGTWGSPDLLSLNGSGVAQLPCGYITCVQPHSGNNVLGFVTYNGYHVDAREYVSTNLTTTMQVGQTYSISFYATTGSLTSASYVSNNIGVLFTNNAVWHGSNSLRINRTPHYNMSTVLDTTGWKYFSFTFVADSAYKYITFGNYYSDANTTLVNKNSTSDVYAYNIIDDITVSHVNSVAVPQTSFMISGSGVCAGKSLAAMDLSSNSPTAWSWQVSGPVSAASTQSNPVFTFSVPGTYSISLTSSNSGGAGTPFTKILTVYPNPTLTASASTSVICQNSQATLLASGATTYSWSSGQTGSLITTASQQTTGNISYSVSGKDQNGCEDTTTVHFTVKVCELTSLFDKQNELFKIEIYPNPNNGSFALRSNKAENIVIVNALGQTILEVDLSLENDYTLKIHDLKPGVYFAKGKNFRSKILIVD
ncbi:hypothetical protein CNR22_12800 [Sphingobacteriaceae bacterium]|nr:hypothetical protein CNR22_12800 [Sphingobacteriaceae bacterium]